MHFFETETTVARARIQDVAKASSLSISTVNRALHEPEKVREETLRSILQAAESIGFYGIGSIKESLKSARPKIRIGILLLQRNRVLYKMLDQTLKTAAMAVHDHEIMMQIEYIDELTPQNVSNCLLRLAESCDLLGVVAATHPLVSAAIEQLSERGIRVFALISQLTARCSVGYIGIDMWKVGRTAGWAIDSMCATPGKIGILVGNHRYRCQETSESGFRSYIREHPRGFEILDARSTFETANIAREVTEELLHQHPDLAGLYITGGGMSGTCAALRESPRAKDIVAVGLDLTEHTRAAMLDGTLNFLISHPLQSMAQEIIAAMIRAHNGGPEFAPQNISLPFDIYTPENL
jgi:LacI family transcriptional regulator